MRPQDDTTTHLPNGTDGLTFTPRKSDSTFLQVRNDLPFNEFTGIYSTFKIGLGYIGDATTYSYDDVFKEQLDSLGISLEPTFKTRDFRAIFSGRLLKSKRFISYRFAYMYDGNAETWLMRETGVTVGVPELKGHFFIGRTKEGFSMIKVMNGHSGIANERQMALDVIPILADGIKYFGYFPKSKIFMNLGVFNDFLSKGQSFSTLQWQYVARVGWVPINDSKKGKVLHMAGNFSYGKPNDGKFTIKSRPGSNPTPHLINTGQFSADHSLSIGAEVFYTNNRFTIGSEVMQHNFTSDKFEDHHFRGGDVIVSYFITKARRKYNTNIGNIFEFVQGGKSVFDGGLGAIEFVFHASTFNLNDGSIKGGQFTRFTPMINWYLSRTIRWEFIYGYGILDRFNLKGKVQFFETRIQFSFL
jgi:phosphate-selective porin OprO/OprP